MNKSIGTIIHGIGSTPHLDSSGERVKLEGIDISTLTLNGVINTEHKSDSTSQIIGKIIEAKKIYSKEDCENKHHLHFLEKAHGPYLYIKAILFDSFGHSGAIDAAAMLKFDKASKIDDDTQKVAGFSVEGSKLEVKNGIVEKCIARKISFTNFPCNKVCIAEILEDENPEKSISFSDFKEAFKKAEDMQKSEELEKALMSPKSPERQKIVAQDTEKIANVQAKFHQGMKSALTSKQNMPTPSEFKGSDLKQKQPILSGSAFKASIEAKRQALKNKPMAPKYQPNKMFKSSLRESIIKKTKKKKEFQKAMKEDCINSFERFSKKEELLQFISQKYPEMEKSQVMALASIYTLSQEKKQEKALKELINE